MLKVLLFLLMVVLAAFATTMLHRRMVRLGAAERAEPPGENVIEYEGRFYDVSGSRVWHDGVHMGRHRTTDNLKEAMASAPHGPEMLDRVPCVGDGRARPTGGELSPPAACFLCSPTRISSAAA